VKRLIITMLAVLFLNTTVSGTVSLPFTDETNYDRIVFLIDASGSMGANDPYRLRLELANMIITLAPIHIEVGFIAFDDEIVGSYPMTTYRDTIQAAIESIVARSWTDIGLGLRYAMELAGNNERTVVVFLTDGENISISPNGRGHHNAVADEQYALELARTYNIPIYAVRFGTGFGMDYLTYLVEETSGRTYQIDNPSQFSTTSLQLISDIFGHNFMLHQETVYVTVTNTPPIFIGDLPDIFLRNENPRVIDLNELFYDPDGGYLSFELIGDYVNIIDDLLVIDLETIQELKFTIIATDEIGASFEQNFNIRVVSFWVYHQTAFWIIGAIFLVLLLLYLLFTRRVKYGTEPIIPILHNNHLFKEARFEGYFLNTLSGNEIPILNWGAAYIENKNIISLGEMLNMLEVEEKLPEAHKLFFEAGNNSTVIFHHMTDCVISLGNRNIQKGKKEVLKFDSKLYITFEDHVTEIEIRYKKVRKKRYGIGTT